MFKFRRNRASTTPISDRSITPPLPPLPLPQTSTTPNNTNTNNNINPTTPTPTIKNIDTSSNQIIINQPQTPTDNATPTTHHTPNHTRPFSSPVRSTINLTQNSPSNQPSIRPRSESPTSFQSTIPPPPPIPPPIPPPLLKPHTNPIRRNPKSSFSSVQSNHSTAGLLAISSVNLLNPSIVPQSQPQPQQQSNGLPKILTDDLQHPIYPSNSHNSSTLDLSSINDSFYEESLLGTGYAVASRKRNLEFHTIFKSIPEDDYLIEDYGCALQRDILVQGRLYISEQHLCFNANIFGWVTTLVLPFSDVARIEKRMTALIIPNAIQVITMHSRHTFASFISRDTTYDLMNNIWRISHPNIPNRDPSLTTIDGEDHNDQEVKVEYVGSGGLNTLESNCKCMDTDEHYKEIVLDTIYDTGLEKIWELVYRSGFLMDFWVQEQSLTEIEQTPWSTLPTIQEGQTTRQTSYVRPLTASMGPKTCRCELKETILNFDLSSSITIETLTRTPEVPSGSNFWVMTRTCLMWSKGGRTRILVCSTVEWSKVNRFLKSIIESSALSGQRAYHHDLDRAIREHLNAHPLEFGIMGVDRTGLEGVPDGQKIGTDGTKPPLPPTTNTTVSNDSRKRGTGVKRHEKLKGLGMYLGLIIVVILLGWNVMRLVPNSKGLPIGKLDHEDHRRIGREELMEAVRDGMEEWWRKGWKEVEVEGLEILLDRIEGRMISLRRAVEREKDMKAGKEKDRESQKEKEEGKEEEKGLVEVVKDEEEEKKVGLDEL